MKSTLRKLYLRRKSIFMKVTISMTIREFFAEIDGDYVGLDEIYG